MRLLAFVLALFLLAGEVDPTRGWLIVLVVLTGLAAFGLRPWAPWDARPRLDMRLAAFVFAVLLLAGTVDATKDVLIALAAVTGVAAFMPHLISLDGGTGHGWGPRSQRRWRHWERRWQRAWDRDERRWRRAWDGDDWP